MSVDRDKLREYGIKGGNAPKHRWAEEEQEIVRRDYRGTRNSAQEIAERLGVTEFAVKGQIALMGITLRGQFKKWTPQQDKQLTALIGRYAIRTIAEKMHRSMNSVTLRAKRLGLKRRIHDGWYTKREVCEIFGVDHHWVQFRIDSGALIASYHNGIRPQKKGMAMWHIEEKNLVDFVRRYPQELIGRNVDIITIVDLLAGLKPLLEK